MARLVKPSVKYKRSYLRALRESIHETQVTRIKDPQGDFPLFVRRYKDFAEGKNLPRGYVPASMYWLVDRNTFIGWVDIRHRLTPKLRRFGGHIGYWIRPRMRKQGYGKVILRLGLKKAKLMNIKKVLVTCDLKNIPSRKIIESNGGIFFDVIRLESGKKERRFWITNL